MTHHPRLPASHPPFSMAAPFVLIFHGPLSEKSKDPGPEGTALVIPEGICFIQKFIDLLKFQIANPKNQTNNNNPNPKSQTKKQPLTLCKNLRCALNRFEFVIWNLRFIWFLVLGICDFRLKTPRQSRLSLTWP